MTASQRLAEAEARWRRLVEICRQYRVAQTPHADSGRKRDEAWTEVLRWREAVARESGPAT